VSGEHPATGSDVTSQLCGSTEKQNGELTVAASITPTAYVIDGDVPFAEWVQHGRRLGVIGRSAGWWIGDWLSYGNTRYGDRYSRASRITGYDAQTLMNMVYVTSRFEPSRRHPGLSWSHHAEVAALPQEEQDRWLARAETDRLSVRCLREEIRRERRAIAAREQGQLPETTGEPEPVSADYDHCPTCGNTLSVVRPRDGTAATAPARVAAASR
jgi:hypothetical protein